MTDDAKHLERRALRIQQNDAMPVYLFALAAEEIDLVADVARISRDDAGKLIGYQRPERRSHVKQILDYLNSGEVLFPNGLILALPESVRFRSSRGPSTSDGLSSAGTLEIPLPTHDTDPRPAWIVDGQQRSLALSRTTNKRMPVPIAGFVAPTLAMQREQFLRINTVSPLPPNLVTELLPEVFAAPSPRLSARRLPSALVDMLNQDPDSPFAGLIKRASTDIDDRRKSVVTDTGLVEALKESLESPSGVLFPYRNMATGSTDTEGIRKLLLTYWTSVRDLFPDAWGKPPTRSRLMGGVGIRAMSRLMDRVMAHVDVNSPTAYETTKYELTRIVNRCHWTSGTWDELGLPWNELQNTPRHISALSNFLARAYVEARMEKK
ncbi:MULTISPECIES: DGQHR domain-containing protein DpdB [Rhodococcus]|uniref:DGQHR domain-containing protein DpdB n=1 Tax=Rhodococcus oxybenzonivorans TaxID=1990687 RepID=A0AAE4UZW6_9NOCA|nr:MULTISPECIES: DGQHR domain-containing protein DpdB [Rhodococcus]MDV7245316.1 DGQHR domain-containing protein DpdB [Rhodococcus oxybenzonivorans]MDV7266111.1 DGQHR domain-containing protein DpdB [Rhodococcus oxybenzonivorans]MDV7272404.1 DGQHR domain-containing protein DpdB [Rhodococcus oxybenzonivorans]MDV7336341.1 DGQHR domain-containing protein DpdB [Rhodococcus oxybenzonivorans]MDV7347641.1 DGQHR domain-containing protein DpdB [Rhodococcus oxybenzonivorans]